MLIRCQGCSGWLSSFKGKDLSGSVVFSNMFSGQKILIQFIERNFVQQILKNHSIGLFSEL